MARLRPSAAGRWVPCPGSVTLCEKYPEEGPESAPAAEGTAAHWVASEMLIADKNWDGVENKVALPSDFINKPAPNGVIVTQDMIDAAKSYVQDVQRVRASAGGDASFYIERHVHIHTVHPENEGTFDSSVFIDNQSAKRFVLWDFKYGWGIVEPHGNWQLLDYAVGLLAEWEERGIPLPETVELRIVQPRAFHPLGAIRSWVATLPEIYRYRETLRTSAAEALGGSPMYVPGVPQCSHCSGRANCTALNRAVYQIQDFIDLAPPVEMSGEALGARVHQLRRYSKLLEALSSGIEERALAQIKEGEIVHGWGSQFGQGRQRWKPGVMEQVVQLGSLMSVDVLKPAELITPKQAIAGGIDTVVISAYSEVPTKGIKLVPMDSEKVEQLFNN